MRDDESTNFSRFVCWDPDAARQIMRIEALDLSRDVFLAVHHPMYIRRREMAGELQHRPYSQEALRDDLLDPTESYRFVLAIGATGTGKSHLVRWLDAHLENSDVRRVILVQKTGTNMRDVLTRVLEGLEGDPFDDYRKRIHTATDFSSGEEGRDRLLKALDLTLRYEKDVVRQKVVASGEAAELRDELLEVLPEILTDPYLRNEHWLRAGSVIARLFDQAFGRMTTEEQEAQEGQHFSATDLPIRMADLRKASGAARDVLEMLIQEELQVLAVDLLNAAVHCALPRVFGLKGQDLYRLFIDVRESFAAQGRELVLLIEDLSKMQGLDMQLIDALQAPVHAEGKALCPVRVVVGCTPVYYNHLTETARDRISFIVSLDLPGGEVEAFDVDGFSARYLNVLRLGPDRIRAHRDEQGDAPFPSACDECQYRGNCHQAFGSVNLPGAGAVGLYPFSPVALGEMYRQKHRSLQEDVFKPRVLLMQVLRPVLVDHVGDLRAGRFPSASVHRLFGGSNPRLPTPQVNELERRVPDLELRERWRALLDLWATATKVHNLHPAVHTAFDLPVLDAVPVVEPEKVDSARPIVVQTRTSFGTQPSSIIERTTRGGGSEVVAQRLHALENWRTGADLDDDLADRLRKLLFEDIVARIDWESENLIRSTFASATGSTPFRRVSIVFQRQYSGGRPANVRLRIPRFIEKGEDIPTDVVLALQGVLLFQEHRHWRFENAGEYFRAYASCLESWSNEVVASLRQGIRDKGEDNSAAATVEWSPLAATVEMLAVSARMAGYPSASKDTVLDGLDALFEDVRSVNPEARSASWRKLFQKVEKNQEALLQLLQSLALCHKGSSRQTPFFDTTALLPALRRLRRNSWVPQEIIPDGAFGLFQPLVEVRQAYDQYMVNAISEEKERYATWQDAVIPLLGTAPDRDRLVDVVNEARKTAVNMGVSLPEAIIDPVRNGRRRLQKVDLKRLLTVVDRVTGNRGETAAERAALLADLGISLEAEILAVGEFAAAADALLSAAMERLEEQLSSLRQAGGGDLEKEVEAILGHLDELDSLLGRLAEQDKVTATIDALAKGDA